MIELECLESCSFTYYTYLLGKQYILVVLCVAINKRFSKNYNTPLTSEIHHPSLTMATAPTTMPMDMNMHMSMGTTMATMMGNDTMTMQVRTKQNTGP